MGWEEVVVRAEEVLRGRVPRLMQVVAFAVIGLGAIVLAWYVIGEVRYLYRIGRGSK